MLTYNSVRVKNKKLLIDLILLILVIIVNPTAFLKKNWNQYSGLTDGF